MIRLVSILSFFLAAFLPLGAKTVLDSSAVPPRLLSDGRGFLILGGELGNSAATSCSDIRHNLQKVASMNLNTVLVPAYWDLIEPEEGNFDFSLTDCAIDAASDNGLGVVFLWFGAWKNSMSCYAPSWVKRDVARFPRARTKVGNPLEILSAFSPDVLEADSKAFTDWLHHVEDYDRNGVVRMVQIENEIGMLEDARDFSELAEKAYASGVPEELTAFLARNAGSLHPELKRRWDDNGNLRSGSWREVFGDDIFSDEYFMAWNYARYVEHLAGEGRKISGVPFYLNAALNSRGRLPGEYPSAGPLAHLKDIWHAGAPSVDFLSPDIYDSGFEGWTAGYALPDNILFIPEVRRDDSNAAQAFYVFGHHRALGFSPFSIENGDEHYVATLAPAYGILGQLSPLLTSLNADIFMDGVLLSKENPSTVVYDGDTRITLSHFFTLPWDSRTTDGSPWRDAGAIIFKLAPDEYILAGTGVVAKFEDISEQNDSVVRGEDGFAERGGGSDGEQRTLSSASRVGLDLVEEVCFSPDGAMEKVRTFNGDETHQGRHARISVDDNKILHIKIYRYN